jgi:hypothetical protein
LFRLDDWPTWISDVAIGFGAADLGTNSLEAEGEVVGRALRRSELADVRLADARPLFLTGDPTAFPAVIFALFVRSGRLELRDAAGGTLVAGIVTRSRVPGGVARLICFGIFISSGRPVGFLCDFGRKSPLRKSPFTPLDFRSSSADDSLSTVNGRSRCLHFDVFAQNPPVADFFPELARVASSVRTTCRLPVPWANPSKGPLIAMKSNNPKQVPRLVRVRCMIDAFKKRERETFMRDIGDSGGFR